MTREAVACTCHYREPQCCAFHGPAASAAAMNLPTNIEAQLLSENEILKFFAYAHLPAHLQPVSQPFHDLAMRIALTVPRNAERTVALRKLLESKDAAVRATL